MVAILLVSLGGILGAVLRWQCIEALPTLSLGVFFVNQLGVLVAGFVAYRMKTTEYQRLFWITGFAGGFTTLSSLAYILQSSSPFSGLLYAVASLITSVVILNLLKVRVKP